MVKPCSLDYALDRKSGPDEMAQEVGNGLSVSEEAASASTLLKV